MQHFLAEAVLIIIALRKFWNTQTKQYWKSDIFLLLKEKYNSQNRPGRVHI